MCRCSPVAEVIRDEKTINAVGEMVAVAVKHYAPDHTGPVEFTMCRPREFSPDELGDTEVFDA